MSDFRKLTETVQDDTLKEVFKIIADQQPDYIADSTLPLPMTADDCTAIKELLYQQVKTNMTLDGGVQSLTTARESSANHVSNMVADAFFNPVNGQGTRFDPGYYNTADIPVSMSPNEATSYYASGGIPSRIIDKKAGGMFINGYRFIGNSWTPQDLEALKEYADSLNFDHVVKESIRDGLIYGGAFMVPHFKRDDAHTHSMSVDSLIREGIIHKNCIDYFWHADRWNCVLVPDYNIAASDYLDPKTIFVPIAGVSVNTGRAAILRPKQLPYWGTLRQMGWGISDMESWIRPLLGYEVCIASIPIMAQQLSILYSHFPADALIANGGANAVRAVAQEIQAQIRTMSNVNPQALNTALELKVLDRNFSGFPELIAVLEKSVCAKAGLSSADIFDTQSSGMNASDNGKHTLKDAGAIQELANKIVPQISNLVKILVYSKFGPNSPQASIADNVRLDFDSPTILTNEERNQAGTTFSAVFTAMIGGGLQPLDALEIGKSFVPDIELPQNVIDKLAEVPAIDETMEQPNGLSAFGAKLRDETGVSNMAESLRGESSGVDALHAKISPAQSDGGMLSRITNPVKRLFQGITK